MFLGFKKKPHLLWSLDEKINNCYIYIISIKRNWIEHVSFFITVTFSLQIWRVILETTFKFNTTYARGAQSIFEHFSLGCNIKPMFITIIYSFYCLFSSPLNSIQMRTFKQNQFDCLTFASPIKKCYMRWLSDSSYSL